MCSAYYQHTLCCRAITTLEIAWSTRPLQRSLKGGRSSRFSLHIWFYHTYQVINIGIYYGKILFRSVLFARNWSIFLSSLPIPFLPLLGWTHFPVLGSFEQDRDSRTSCLCSLPNHQGGGATCFVLQSAPISQTKLNRYSGSRWNQEPQSDQATKN